MHAPLDSDWTAPTCERASKRSRPSRAGYSGSEWTHCFNQASSAHRYVSPTAPPIYMDRGVNSLALNLHPVEVRSGLRALLSAAACWLPLAGRSPGRPRPVHPLIALHAGSSASWSSDPTDASQAKALLCSAPVSPDSEHSIVEATCSEHSLELMCVSAYSGSALGRSGLDYWHGLPPVGCCYAGKEPCALQGDLR